MRAILTFILLFLFVVLFSPDRLNAQNEAPALTFKNLLPEKGLSSGNIISILKDHQGYIWIGTSEGLNKYDGLKFTAYKNKRNDSTSLSSNYINTLFEDSHNNLWIGVSNGICKYNRTYDTFEKINLPDQQGKPFSHFVSAIYEDRQNRLWIGSNGGAFILDRKNNHFIPYFQNEVSSKDVLQIKEDRNGNILLAYSGSGLIRYSPKNHQLEKISPTHPVFPLANDDIYSIAVDQKNRIWLGYRSKGLSVLDEEKKTITHFQHQKEDPNSLCGNDIASIDIDANNNVFIGTNGQGLSVFNATDNYFHSYYASEASGSLLSNNISKIYVANDGMVWIGCWGSGLSIYDKRFVKFQHFKEEELNPNSLSGKSVTSFCEDQNGIIWISTDGGGINGFNYGDKKFYNTKSIHGFMDTNASKKMLALVTDGHNELWAGSWNDGLYRFTIDDTKLKLRKNYKKFRSEYANNTSVFKLYRNPKNEIWVGSFFTSAFRYNEENDAFVSIESMIDNPNDTVTHLSINDILHDIDDTYWLAAQDFGLYKLNLATRKITRYPQALDDSLGQPANSINFSFQDSKSRWWFGTDAGLTLFNKTNETFRTFTVDHGLPSNNIVGMLEDNHGNFWISSNKGLSKMRMMDSNEIPTLQIRNFTIPDGLQGDIFNHWAYFKSRTGEMYFGGLNGFNVFHPDSIGDNTAIPPVHLTNFHLFNKPVKPGTVGSPLRKQLSQTDELILRHNQNYFTIEYVALNYIMAENNQYAYLLEGLDNEWNYVGHRTEATYTHLQPGTYVFRVKASNNDGYWNETGASIKIRILPPWWQSWWFNSIIVILVLFVTTILVVRFIMHVRRLANQSILNERNQLQTLIDNIPDQIFIKDLFSRFIVVNKNTVNHFEEKNKQSVIHKTDFDFYSHEDATKFFEHEKEIMDTGVSSFNVESKRMVYGEEKYFLTTKCPIINSKGETIGLVGIVRDITTQKQTEIQLHQQSEELQAMNKALKETNELLEIRQNLIEEQTDELYHQKEELLHRNAQLNEINATKDKLFSIIAHDVKNPFNMIVGFSELLIHNVNKWDADEIKNASSFIYDASSKLSDLLENLLQWARNQRGMIEFNPRPIRYLPFIENMMTFFELSLQQKEITIESTCDDPEIILHGDLQLLDLIVRNLIGNAIKFTQPGGHVRIQLQKEAGFAIISISDNGIGISEIAMQNLFSIINQSTIRGTSNEKGTGLGLILVKEFVEKQGGTVWVESRQGKGATFYFTVPVVR